MSMYVTERDEFTRLSPMAQQRNVGVRRPGYKATLVRQEFKMTIHEPHYLVAFMETDIEHEIPVACLLNFGS